MAKYYRRYKVSGVVKFCDNLALGEDLKEAKGDAHRHIIQNLISADSYGTLELVELSEIEDLGLTEYEID